MKIFQGIDITSVSRVRNILTRREGRVFQKRVFTPAEIRYCESRRMKYEHYAARYAAKEAVTKALGARGRKLPAYGEIEIRNYPTGKPYVKLSKTCRRRLRLPAKTRFEISLTHERRYAMAAVILILP